MSTVPVPASLAYTVDNVNSGAVKIKNMKLMELKELRGYYHEVIQDLKKKLKEEKASDLVKEDLFRNDETSVQINAELKELKELRAELKELKDLVEVDGFNAKGDKPTGSLSQLDWYTAAVREDNKAKHGARAKLVEEAKTTDRWCLLQHVPVTQEAKAK
jgi:hypothetical protein